jgi:hypothetical protein
VFCKLYSEFCKSSFELVMMAWPFTSTLCRFKSIFIVILFHDDKLPYSDHVIRINYK